MANYQYVDKSGALQTMTADNPTSALSAIQGISDPSSGVMRIGDTKIEPQVTTTTSQSNPAIDSSPIVNTNNAIKADITDLTKAHEQEQIALENERLARETMRKETLAGIESEFNIAAQQQADTQKKQYAGRATGLVTAGGGFLGGTQSHEGVLANLQQTFDQEKSALMAKKASAIAQANAAWLEKDFALARAKATEAKEYQQEIYNRQKDFASQQLDLAKEARAKAEFDYGITDKRAKSYSEMPDTEYARITPEEKATIDAKYFPGYLDNLQRVTQRATTIKTTQDQVNLDKDILDMRLKMPYGQTFKLGNVEYTGLKKDTKETLTATERKDAIFAKFSELLSGQLNDKGLQLYTVPGSGGVPYIETDTGYLTKKGWEYLSGNLGGIPVNEFIERNSHLFNPDAIAQYKLSQVQKNLITGKL